MEKDQLDSVASYMIAAYGETAVYSRRFLEDHGSPPSVMAKTHHLRSILQAELAQNERYLLSAEFAELGRVRFTDTATGLEYQLRSQTAIAIEKARKGVQLALFDAAALRSASAMPKTETGVQLLVFKFIEAGLDLSVCRAVVKSGTKRLLPVGSQTYIGFWPYSDFGNEPPPFDQATGDPFGDVGDLGVEDDEGEGQA